MKRFEVIDFLRGFAIFTIVLMHCVQGYLDGFLHKAVSFGGAGVHVFILCSGFGLYLSHLNKPLGYVDFLKRRFGKVYMPYVVVIGLFALWGGVSSGIVDWKAAASHVFLYKMFDNELDVSICYPFWFLSTIIQFYICFPLIIRMIRIRGGYWLAPLISLLWASVVGWLGYEEYRPWGSSFLQYLWEFALGMWIADKVKSSGCSEDETMFRFKTCYLIVGVIAGMGLTAVMGWGGGFWALYNDVPSLLGYGSLSILIYKFNIKCINSFFEYTSKIGYEWYLVHCFVFVIVHYFMDGLLPVWMVLVVCFFLSYGAAFGFNRLVSSVAEALIKTGDKDKR